MSRYTTLQILTHINHNFRHDQAAKVVHRQINLNAERTVLLLYTREVMGSNSSVQLGCYKIFGSLRQGRKTTAT